MQSSESTKQPIALIPKRLTRLSWVQGVAIVKNFKRGAASQLPGILASQHSKKLIKTVIDFAQKYLFSLIIILLLSVPPCHLYAQDDIETAGDILQVALPVWAYAMTFTNDDSEGSIQFTQSFLTAMATTYATKLTVDRERPNGGDMSFPSGHTSAAFSGAAFIQMRYGWLYGSMAYAGAAYVGWSRVVTENHYVEDVIAGAGIGIISAAIFTKPYLDKIHILPFVSQERTGVTLLVKW